MIKLFGADDFQKLSVAAANATRKRAHLNVHEKLEAQVQRLFIATEPGTYIRPHRHPEAHKWEFLIVLAGELDVLIFNESGDISQRQTLKPDAVSAIEISPNTWHSYVCKNPATIALEIKEGAYIATTENNFAPWAPAEGSEQCPQYLQWMQAAEVVSRSD